MTSRAKRRRGSISWASGMLKRKHCEPAAVSCHLEVIAIGVDAKLDVIRDPERVKATLITDQGHRAHRLPASAGWPWLETALLHTEEYAPHLSATAVGGSSPSPLSPSYRAPTHLHRHGHDADVSCPRIFRGECIGKQPPGNQPDGARRVGRSCVPMAGAVTTRLTRIARRIGWSVRGSHRAPSPPSGP